MLRMKLITLLKNPCVRIALIVITAIAIVAGLMSLKINADMEEVAFRAATMKVSVGTKDIKMPEIGPGQDKQQEKESKYSNVYCIDEGTNLDYAVYNQQKNLYNGPESKIYFKNYNAALWLVDNMYISTATNKEVSLDYLANLVTSPDVKKSITAYGNITSENIKSLNKTVGNYKDIAGNTINRNLIEVVEQLVIWNYTNNANNTDAQKYDKLVNGGFSGYNITNEDQNACKYLYYALKHLANKQSNYTSNGTVNNVISLEKSTANIDLTKKQVGPYYLKANGVTLNIDNTYKSKISATVTDSQGKAKTLTSEQIKVNNDGSFYIDISNCADVKKVQLSIGAIYSGAETTAQVIVNEVNQNLLNIKKVVKSQGANDLKEISYSGNYTIKLIKVKKDGTTAVTNNPAKFDVSGAVNKNDLTTNNDGIRTITDSKKIESTTQSDVYKIIETKAPTGLQKYNGEINLTVKFKKDGTNFVIDEDNTKLSATGTNGSIKLKYPSNSIIEIYVPNQEQPKPTPEFDLSLRKFISKIDGKQVNVSREPIINEISKQILDEYKTAAYHHTKQPLKVNTGSKIEYTIRVYNEGKVDGYAKEITDYLPEGLKFVKIADEYATEYTTNAASDSKVIVLKYNGNTVVKANSIDRILNNETQNIYQEVKIICEVKEGSKGYITNRAEISNYGYNDNGTWKEAKAIGDSDRDSVQNTISNAANLDKWYESAKAYTYTDSTGKNVTIENYYPGVQDDDDFETVEVKEITGEYKVVIKKVDSSNKNKGLEGAYFTIGKETKIGPTDKNGMIDVIKNTITSNKQTDSITIKETTAPEGYEGYEQEIKVQISTKQSGDKYIVDKENTKIANNEHNKVSLNVDDKESIVTIIIENDKKDFDLALRKFITKINDKNITGREPKVDVSELKTGTVTTAKYYDYSKDPIDVCKNNIVTYTLRVYNEAGLSGYATKIMDDVPDGLEFLPNDSTNTKYKWKMYTESTTSSSDSITYDKKTYVPTTDVTKADVIVTDYLKDELIKGFDPETMTTLDFKDVKVAFKVVEPNTSDRIIINYAQITEDADFNKEDVTDRDSVPNEWTEGEDDQDIEKIKLNYFDLSLRKWVTEAIVSENGQTQVIQTGHKAEDNPENVVKVDLKKSKLNQVTVKFRYSIRVTNDGDIAGYAKEVSDYIPEGLKFVAEDNPEWTEKDGKVVTRALENTLLKTGESAEVSILLTWINDSENMGVKTNTAEISEDYNDFGEPDKDSTPNNKVPGEDDIDDAPVMLTVKTGSKVIVYVSLGLGTLAIIGLGVFGIKKYVQ
ncbi:MAG: Cys-Gln thioester bond-forming surface protein [Clostridia bacterium]|nr:Cys-Gln thioester bond-forming surface protein [Clostridia bacterium]